MESDADEENDYKSHGDNSFEPMQREDSRKRRLHSDSDQYRNKRSNMTSDTVLLKQLIPSQLSGAVLGKSGVTISAMIKETDSSIKMSNPNDFFPGTNDRVLVITGKAENVEKAHKLVWEKLRDRNEIVDDLKMKLVVPRCTVGMIMGKAGSYIKQVKEQTGAFVVVSPKDPEQRLPERVVSISGSTKSISEAFDMIFEMICNDPQSGSCPNQNYSSSAVANNQRPTPSPSYANLRAPPAPSIEMAPTSGRFDARPNDTVVMVKATLRNAGNSVHDTEAVAAALCTLSGYGLLGFGSGCGMHGCGLGGVGSSSVGGLSLQYLTSILHGVAKPNIPVAGGDGVNDVIGGGFNRNNYNNSCNYDGGQRRYNGNEASVFMGGNNNLFGGGGGAFSYTPGETSSYGRGEAVVVEKVHVHETFVGAVLGPGGKAIVEIQRSTGATIAISDKGVFAPGTRNRIVTIKGIQSSVKRAVQDVKEHIAKAENKWARRDRTNE